MLKSVTEKIFQQRKTNPSGSGQALPSWRNSWKKLEGVTQVRQLKAFKRSLDVQGRQAELKYLRARMEQVA